MLVYIVSSIPGIGEKRAKELLSRYGTLRNLFASRDWRMKGFGDKLNEKVQSLLDMKYGGDEKR